MSPFFFLIYKVKHNLQIKRKKKAVLDYYNEFQEFFTE